MSLRSMHFGLRAIFALMVMALIISVQSVRAANVVTGTVEKVDTTSKTITVKTADGTIKVVKYSGDAAVSGVKGVTKGAEFTGKETGTVIVHTVGTGADETAKSVVWVGDKTVKTTQGVVEDTGKGAKMISIKTADGTKETFVVADHATVDTGKDIGKYSVVGAKKGEQVTVYYTDDAGKKVAHVFEHF